MCFCHQRHGRCVVAHTLSHGSWRGCKAIEHLHSLDGEKEEKERRRRLRVGHGSHDEPQVQDRKGKVRTTL